MGALHCSYIQMDVHTTMLKASQNKKVLSAPDICPPCLLTTPDISPSLLVLVHESCWSHKLLFQYFGNMLVFCVLCFTVFGGQSCTATSRVRRWWIAERPLDIEASCDISGSQPDE